MGRVSELQLSGTGGVTADEWVSGDCNPMPGRHGDFTERDVRYAAYSAEWWHSRYTLTGSAGDYYKYLDAVTRLQETRQYCPEYTRKGGLI